VLKNYAPNQYPSRSVQTVAVTLAGKDPVLIDVVERLRNDLGPDFFVIVDHWRDDPIAVGLARPDDFAVLVYVTLQLDSTDDGPEYKLLDSLYYECELPTADGQYDVADRGDGVGYGQVLKAVRTHLAS
jgi:hypothetical protein